jgi:hypothetical protein
MACHSDDQREKLPRTKIDMKDFDEDIVIPTSLWKAFEESFPALTEDAPVVGAEAKEGEKKDSKKKKSDKESKQDAEEKELLKHRPVVDGLPFTVYLLEKTPQILGGQNYELNYGPVGGNLDFAKYVEEKKNGTFFLKVKYGAEMDPKLTKIYFLSNAAVHNVNNRPAGSGCNKYYEITKYWKNAMKDDGLILNTSGLRHLAITTGTFYFVAPFKNKLRMGHITITDSRHKNLLCQVDQKN